MMLLPVQLHARSSRTCPRLLSPGAPTPVPGRQPAASPWGPHPGPGPFTQPPPHHSTPCPELAGQDPAPPPTTRSHTHPLLGRGAPH